MRTILYAALPLVVATAACSRQSDEPSGTAREDAAATSDASTLSAGNGTTGAAASTAASVEASRLITLTGFSCGDNCYLEFTDGDEAKTALCRASQCSEWADAQTLPGALKGKRAFARFGTGNQVDAAGTVMSRKYQTIEELRIAGHDAASPAPAVQVSTGESLAPSRKSGGGVAAVGPTVPVRFRGLFAVDRKACAEDYTYSPAFQNVTVKARSVSFFETGGPVTNVNIQGDIAAITLLEIVGDGKFTRAIYLALNRDGTVRYRPGKSEPSRTYIRCGASPG